MRSVFIIILAVGMILCTTASVMAAGAGLSRTPAWVKESGGYWSYYGKAVASAGDTDNDGYDEVIVGAPKWNNGVSDQGRAFAYMGNATGVTSAPYWAQISYSLYAHYGDAVAGLGDVNGDGYEDAAVGMPFYTNGQQEEGYAYVYLGTSTGLSTSPQFGQEGNAAYSYYGGSLAGAGDVNSDGYDDFLVGQRGYDSGRGKVYLYYGSSGGVSSTAAWTYYDFFSALVGQSVDGAGDVNGDGYDDIIVGVPYWGAESPGAALVFHGGASGLPSFDDWMAEGEGSGDEFGWSVEGDCDVNGDGYADVIVGAPHAGSNSEGSAHVFLGSEAGLEEDAVWSYSLTSQNARFGWAVACAGDVNDDGYDDVLAGTPYYNAEGGLVLLFYGGEDGPEASYAWMLAGDQTGMHLGESLASAGDVNNDGYADVIIGAPQFGHSYDREGKAVVYLGGCASGCSSGTGCYITGEVNPSNVCQICQGTEWIANDGVSCTDGVFCNGADTCLNQTCSTHAGNPCPDDTLWCNGTESCSEQLDVCLHSGNPCPDDGQWCNGDEYCNDTTDQCRTTGVRCGDDGLWCNGTESCDETNNECDHTGDPCSDDGLFCTGTESCNETSDQCVHSGDPCPSDGAFCNGTESCDEVNNECDHSGNPCSDDGLWCNGTESCNEDGDQCLHSGDPCLDDGTFCNGTESCDEDGEECVSSGDPCSDDGLFCNGYESCDEEASQCTHSGDPCVDSLFCNGEEACDETENNCIAGAAPCPDNEQFCDGLEGCDENTDLCTHSGDPCDPTTQTCDEIEDVCAPLSDDDTMDDDSSGDDTDGDDVDDDDAGSGGGSSSGGDDGGGGCGC